MALQENTAPALAVGVDQDDYAVLATDLEQLGLISVGVPTARLALEILDRERIDLLLLNVRLPDSNGLAFATRFVGCTGQGWSS